MKILKMGILGVATSILLSTNLTANETINEIKSVVKSHYMGAYNNDYKKFEENLAPNSKDMFRARFYYSCPNFLDNHIKPEIEKALKENNVTIDNLKSIKTIDTKTQYKVLNACLVAGKGGQLDLYDDLEINIKKVKKVMKTIYKVNLNLMSIVNDTVVKSKRNLTLKLNKDTGKWIINY